MRPKCDRETIITFNELDKEAYVYTYNQKIIKKLDILLIERPEECVLLANQRSDNERGYKIPKKWVKISQPKNYSEEHRQKLRENLAKNRGKKHV